MFQLVFTALILAASLALGSTTNSTVQVRKCGFHVSDDALIAAEKHFAANAVSRAAFDKRTPDDTNATIPVYFHVIYSDDTINGGNVSEQAIQRAITRLNEDYSNTGLAFSLVNTTRTLNPEWFENVQPGSTLQDDMKKQLRQGGASALNIYSVSFHVAEDMDSVLLGDSTFPANYTSSPTDDGVVVRYNILPGESGAEFGVSKMLTHEVGHWAGLYHTFQGGCDGSGDQIDDTPAEAIPSRGCDVQRDSCPSDPGLDPVHNFMDFSDDDCMREFTPGQMARMADQLRTYRGISI